MVNENDKVEVGALILFANRLMETVAFYQALGMPLEKEHHGEGPLHFACELGPTHFAVFEGTPGSRPPFRSAGEMMPGFAVSSLDHSFQAVKLLGAKVVEAPTDYPWGSRMLVEDPDGRTVEVFQRRS